MGMQDRDYYRERHKVTPQSPGSTARENLAKIAQGLPTSYIHSLRLPVRTRAQSATQRPR